MYITVHGSKKVNFVSSLSFWNTSYYIVGVINAFVFCSVSDLIKCSLALFAC